ncbi:NAD-dependent protein deacetylase [Halieaceae bacterium IMCC14734]|uniref:protein acetyllysine N-acetyltransferase n=1 Tax=Candidatus Litorirhabdus singularis TaxID=2518993 RepID=A0ABT3TBE1_9GAMM|nr:NAD-dependent protein deacetylase [Candidatus Litorirhabdus singularis]
MVAELTHFIRQNRRLVVITGAGMSVRSGIPTYRDDQGNWLRSDPIKHQEFIDSAQVRQRYWSRSLAGWPAVRNSQPGAGHRSLVQLEQAGFIDLLVTQNVDRLHQRAGHREVVDLHGRLDNVRCLSCEAQVHREALQAQLERFNPNVSRQPGALLPDGDADVAAHVVDQFKVPACEACGGVLMPDVVFFGGTVPKQRVAQINDAITAADGVLAVGSSLTVFSSFRFCRLAAQLGKPLALLNRGETRADAIAQLKIAGDCDGVLAQVAEALMSPA